MNDKTYKILLSSPHMSGREWKYLEEAFEKNQVFPKGDNVLGLEKDIRQFTGTQAATCLSSGTAALHLALVILGVSRGDEVLCSTFTYSASAYPIAYQGATPVFIDSEPETWNMSPELMEKAIRERTRKGKKPGAIILTHLYGMPARMDELLDIAGRYDIPLIEDAAEAIGSRYKDRHLGTLGEIGVLSFNGNKIITTSGGGALMSDRKEHCDKALFLATQARDEAPHYEHSHIGYNYRMSNIVAGIGRGQMEVISERIASRRENFTFYRQSLQKYEEITFLTEPDSDFFSNYWLTTCLVDPAQKSSRELRLYLQEHNIETRPLWKPMHLQPVFRDAPAYTDGTSEKLFQEGLCLPSGSNLTREQKNYVVDSIASFMESQQPTV